MACLDSINLNISSQVLSVSSLRVVLHYLVVNNLSRTLAVFSDNPPKVQHLFSEEVLVQVAALVSLKLLIK